MEYPALIALLANAILSNPDPHNRFKVKAGVAMRHPALRVTCRAKYAASLLDGMTLPKYASSMSDGSIPVLVKADCVATTPNCVADKSLRDPPKAPKGVRLAAMTNTPFGKVATDIFEE